MPAVSPQVSAAQAKPTPADRRVLGDKHPGTRNLAADGDALHDAQQQQ